MADQTLREQLRESETRNAESRCELAALAAENEALRLEQQSLRASQQMLQDELPSRREPQSKAEQELAALRHDYEALLNATQTITSERDTLRERVAELEAAHHRLVDMLWGRRSERRSESPGQQHLNFPEEPVDPTEPEQQEAIAARVEADEEFDQELLRRLKARREARRQRRSRSEKFPPHIERRVRLIDLDEEQKQGLKCIGVKVTERLRFEKPTVYVEQIRRPQYAEAGHPEKGVRSAPPPLSIIKGCKYDFSIITAIIALKFAFHNPTYRQQDWFAQCGWFPSRSTANDLINYSVATIDPLHEQMWSLLLEQPILLGDDTTLCVLLRNSLGEEELAQLGQRSAFRQALDTRQPPHTGPPGSATSYAWLYTGLDCLVPYNVFHWSLTHHNWVIDTHLATYQGVFCGDACGANARLEQRSGGRIRHSSCNAHARREFVKAESNDPLLASQGLSFYRQLYDVEERSTTLDAAGRWELRQRDAVPIWNRFRGWLESDAMQRVLPKSAIGQAIGYLRNQWSALQVYLGDGRIPIDNDQSEQMIRPLTVGRDNWMFLGHPQAAPGRLRLYSIVSSAHRHHLVIEEYLQDVLIRLADARQHHPGDLELGSPYLLDLLPDRWAAAHPKSVRQERVDERQMVSDRKRERRARARVAARAAQAAGAR
jgi:transposase